MMAIKAVAPYRHPGFLNFKAAPYEAWVQCGGQTVRSCYPPRILHGLAFRCELPTIWKRRDEARLRFVEPVSVKFDAFPDYACREVIPMVWDCWPQYFEPMCRWMQKHAVNTAIFTSSQTAERMQQRFPRMNIMHCPEAVDTSLYDAGKPLTERGIDMLEFGRGTNLKLDARSLIACYRRDARTLNLKPGGCRYISTVKNGKFTFTNEQLRDAMANAQVTIAVPRSWTQPEVAGGIETLTQRYWESMLSRMVMVGHAPQELTDLIGYNPVVEMNREHPAEQICDILAHIEDYQPLVDRNREAALKHGDWKLRMREVMDFLRGKGYEV